MLLVLCLCSH